MDTINEFADILEPMLQHQWITYNSVEITGIVNSPIALYDAITEARDDELEMLCFIPNETPHMGQWYRSCNLYMPMVLK
ncbi:MAG: hypothetical protein DRI46_08070 [Chloroflexi bacterium]|nr:MAG: hypothetical protein DRI46_08070 [Chloroflexota bacterium]